MNKSNNSNNLFSNYNEINDPSFFSNFSDFGFLEASGCQKKLQGISKRNEEQDKTMKILNELSNDEMLKSLNEVIEKNKDKDIKNINSDKKNIIPDKTITEIDESTNILFKDFVKEMDFKEKKKRNFTCEACKGYKKTIQGLQKELNALSKKITVERKTKEFYQTVCAGANVQILQILLKENVALKEKIGEFQKKNREKEQKKKNLTVENTFNFSIKNTLNKLKDESKEEILETMKKMYQKMNEQEGAIEHYKEKAKLYKHAVQEAMNLYSKAKEIIKELKNKKNVEKNEAEAESKSEDENEDEDEVESNKSNDFTEKTEKKKEKSMYSEYSYEYTGKKKRRTKVKKYVPADEYFGNFDFH